MIPSLKLAWLIEEKLEDFKLMVGIPPIKMVMTGGWFIIAIPTLVKFDDLK